MIDPSAPVKLISIGRPSPEAVRRFNDFLFDCEQSRLRALVDERAAQMEKFGEILTGMQTAVSVESAL